MARDPSDRLFARFRARRDPRALAAVFDRTAPELLAVARHLARDVHHAEDLVQHTFSKAIEHAARYDPRRPVLPWLLGILANQARHDRRQHARALDERAAARAAEDPAAAAARRELGDALRAALRGLHEPYRQVMLLHLEHGWSAGRIAELTGRKPATVRTQIARGLEQLRKLLPAGFAASTAVVVATGRGLAAVRAAVLAQLAPLPAAGLALTGGVLMTNKLLLAAAALVAAATFWVWQRGADAPAAPPPLGGATAAQAAEGPSRALAEGAAAGGAPARQALAAGADGKALGALQVRVRYARDGAPAGDVGIHLRSADISPVGWEERTDAGGRATFAALPPGEVYLVPDRAPARTAFVAVGRETVLDIDVPAGVDVLGLVIDPAGTPVAGATIWAGCLAHPDFAQRVACADAEGRFALRDMPPQTRLMARAPGFQPSGPRWESLDGAPGSRSEVRLRLGARGAPLRGVVRAIDGAPVPHAQIAVLVDEDCRKHVDGLRARPRVGGEEGRRGLDREWFLLRADAEGRFATDEVPEGDALLVARAPGNDPPQIACTRVDVHRGAPSRVELRLAPGAEIVGSVHDEEGAPYANVPMLVAWEGERLLGNPAKGSDAAHLLTTVRTRTDHNGAFHARGLLPGEHDVYVGARFDARLQIGEGFALRRRVELAPLQVLRCDLVARRTADFVVRLLGPDGVPLAGWGVLAHAGAPSFEGNRLRRQRTDDTGAVSLRGLARAQSYVLAVHAPLSDPRAGGVALGRFPAKTVAEMSARGEEIVIRLDDREMPRARLRGRFVGADAPRAELLLDGYDDREPILAATDGSFACENLPAGTYRLRVPSAADVALGPFALAAGADLDLGALVVPEPALLSIRLRCADGGPIDTPRVVHLPSEGDPARPVRQRGSRFEVRLALGRHRLLASGRDLAPSVHEVDVRAGERRRELVCARGQPQAFAVELPPGRSPRRREGRAGLGDYGIGAADAPGLLCNGDLRDLRFAVHLLPGRYRIRVEVDGFGRVYRTFEVREGESAPITIAVK